MRFVDAEYHRYGESGLEGLEMALNEVFVIWYVIDILYYTIIEVSWGFEMVSCNNYDKQITSDYYNSFIIIIWLKVIGQFIFLFIVVSNGYSCEFISCKKIACLF